MFNRVSVKILLIVAVTLSTLQTLVSCSEQSSPVLQPTPQNQQLNALPENFRAALRNETSEYQLEFFAKPETERNNIIAAWQQRMDLIAPFNRSERVLISILSQDDTESFLAIAADNKDQQEQFLADAEDRYSGMLNYCLVSTHRRFGAAIKTPINEAAKKHFTLSEQAIIKSLTPSEAKEFFATPVDAQQKFLADAVDRKTQQLLNCVSRVSRHSEEGSREPPEEDSPQL